MRDFNSLTRDRIHIPYTGGGFLTTGPPRKSLMLTSWGLNALPAFSPSQVDCCRNAWLRAALLRSTHSHSSWALGHQIHVCRELGMPEIRMHPHVWCSLRHHQVDHPAACGSAHNAGLVVAFEEGFVSLRSRVSFMLLQLEWLWGLLTRRGKVPNFISPPS